MAWVLESVALAVEFSQHSSIHQSLRSNALELQNFSRLSTINRPRTNERRMGTRTKDEPKQESVKLYLRRPSSFFLIFVFVLVGQWNVHNFAFGWPDGWPDKSRSPPPPSSSYGLALRCLQVSQPEMDEDSMTSSSIITRKQVSGGVFGQQIVHRHRNGKSRDSEHD